jgi:hypothetical protein
MFAMRLWTPTASALLLAPAAAAAAQAPGALELVALDGSAETLDASDLASLPAEEVTALEDGASVTYRGPAVRELATRAGAPTGRGLRGPAMTVALLAEASDGYAVGFMLSELDPQFGARTAIVALVRNGEPLADGDGPLRVVVAGEAFHARWVRGLVRLRLIDVAAPGPSPGAR